MTASAKQSASAATAVQTAIRGILFMVKWVITKGGSQAHQKWWTNGICPCLVAAMGDGGGYTPILIYELEKIDDEKYEPVVISERR